MPTNSPDYQLMLIVPRASLPLQMSGALWLLFPGSLALAWCIGWAVLQLVRSTPQTREYIPVWE